MKTAWLIVITGWILCSMLITCKGSEIHLADYGGYRPHYQGFGTKTPGGRGGQILRVTNLNDSGPGSLRAALEASGPRVVIFETSGTIELQSDINITSPYLTIAGQTAPSPGINVQNNGIHINAHDVVVQHIRMRYGDTNPEPYQGVIFQVDEFGDNVVLDHVSAAWAMYLAFGANDIVGGENPPTNISVLDSISAFPLSKSAELHDEQWCGMGALMGHMQSKPDTHWYTYARTLWVHNSSRIPQLTAGRFQEINNVVYGCGPWQGWGFIQIWPNWNDKGANSRPGYGIDAVITNNYIIPSTGTGSGPTAGSPPGQKAFTFNIDPLQLEKQYVKVWLSDNQGPGITGPALAGQQAGIYWFADWGGIGANDPRLWYTAVPSWHASQIFQTIPAADVTNYVLANAGARPLDRDSVDIAAVAQTKAGLIHDLPNMGSRVTSQNDMGGYPKLAVNTRKLQGPENPNAVAPRQKFRTNVEMWLEKLARELEPAL